MNVIVVGCGRVGAELAYRLYRAKYRVTVIDHTPAAFDRLHPSFRGRTLEGDVLSQDLLRRSDIEHADGLAAVTRLDSLNAVVAHVARTVYHVPRVLVRNFDPRWRPLYEAFGLQFISSSSWGAQRLAELLTPGALHSVFSAGNGEVQLYEVLVTPAGQGRSLQELTGDSGCVPAALTRAGHASLPAPETALEAGDVLHVSATRDGVAALRQRLAPERRD